MSIFDKFKLGLSKSSKNLSSGLNDLIFKKKIEENELNELEDFLIQSDVGVEVASELKKKFSSTKIDPKKDHLNQIFQIFSDHILEILKPLEKNLEKLSKNKPCVILIAGVNGVGKTTTIGKLGKILGQNNKKVVLGAADTFRAAAVSQLEVWAKKLMLMLSNLKKAQTLLRLHTKPSNMQKIITLNMSLSIQREDSKIKKI